MTFTYGDKGKIRILLKKKGVRNNKDFFFYGDEEKISSI